MHSHDDYLLRLLVEEGQLDPAAVERATQIASEKGISIDDALTQSTRLTAKCVAISRSTLCECPFLDLDRYDIDINNSMLIPRNIAEKHGVFPLFVVNNVATLGMVDPLNVRAIDQVRPHLRAEIEPVLCVPSQLKALISRAYSLSSHAQGIEDAPTSTISADLTTGEEPIVAAVNQIIADAVDANASDIHISPDDHDLQLRYRVDGELQPRQGPGLTSHTGIIQRLKVMAGLDLTQTRRPQDGKFRFTGHGDPVEVRLSTMPTVCGENAVMRLIRPHAQILGFAELGLGHDATRIEELIEQPYGMILVTGPTGSGKTSTLYTAVRKLNTPDRNIMTIEDPVEIRMPGIRQIQTNTEIGLTFAGALRSVLRQDPDVVLVGEIRDSETAMIASQASLTGHMVLSTLHTNDAAGAIARLKDLGVPGFVINASLLGALAQRLVRRTCRQCAKAYTPSPLLLRRFDTDGSDGAYMRGSGCSFCSSSGYRGRLGIFELMVLDPALQEAIDSDQPTHEIQRIAVANGMQPMWQDGLNKARLGLTTLEEVAKAVTTIDSVTAAPSESRREAA